MSYFCFSGGAEANGEAAGQIQQDLRHEAAGIVQFQFSVTFCLLYHVIIGLLQEIFEVNQAFKTPHVSPSSARKAQLYIRKLYII